MKNPILQIASIALTVLLACLTAHSPTSAAITTSRARAPIYEIKPAGVLDGIWGSSNADKIGTERAVKQR